MLEIKKIPKSKNAYQHQLLIKSFLQNALMVNPENEIVYRDKFRHNYYGMQKRVSQYANLLSKIGLKGGKVVGVWDYDSHRFLESYFAIPMTANILHTINWRLSPAQIAYTINHAEDEVILINSEFLSILESIIDELTTVKTIIIIQENEEEKIDTKIKYLGEYEELLAKESDKYDFPDFEDDAIATIFYTSGTTGDPKGVFFSHKQLVLHSLVMAISQGISNWSAKILSTDVYLPLTPMFHAHAWGVPFTATMLGLKQVYIGKFDPETFCHYFQKENPTFTHCVPTVLTMILNHPSAKGIDFSRWKLLIGGSALPEGLARQALMRGIEVVTGYGMSETGPLITVSYTPARLITNDLDKKVKMSTRTGKPVLFADLKIVDENNKEVKKDDNKTGEVVLRAPYLTMGYYKDEEKGDELWENGYLHTGDLASVNGNHEIMIRDRVKDVIKTGGEWISSLLLENLISECEGVMEVAVVAVPDPKWMERPYALVVKKHGYELSEEEIKNYLKQYVDSHVINKWAIPEDIAIVDSIPKTSVGKINKKLIRQQLIDKE